MDPIQDSPANKRQSREKHSRARELLAAHVPAVLLAPLLS